MSKKKDAVLKEYVQSLTDDNIRYVCFLLDERKSGDVGESVELLQQNPELDQLFLLAENADDLYDLVDEIHEYLKREHTNRNRPSVNYS